MRRKQNGFTIVELLIVIVVIAILAAISIVSFTGIQSRAKVAKKESTVSTINKKMEVYKIDNTDYPDTPSALLTDTDMKGLSDSVVVSNSNSYRHCDESTPALTKDKICIASEFSAYSLFWWNDQEDVWKADVHFRNGGNNWSMNSGNGDMPVGLPS